jgi:hypothetical protein
LSDTSSTYGEQRLLGHLAWVNAGRVWDAARAMWRAKPVQMDVFAASLVRFLPNDRVRSGFGNRLYGAYATAGALIPQAVVEPYVRPPRREPGQRARAARHAAADQGRRPDRRQLPPAWTTAWRWRRNAAAWRRTT